MPEITLPTNLSDASGFLWDIQGDGNIINGTDDAYDGGLILSGFPSFSTAQTEDNGREVVIGPAAIDGVNVTRKIYVPEDQSFARFLEIVTNTSSSTVNFTVNLDTNLGSDGSTVLVSTSSGDTNFTTEDNWLVTDDFDNGGDPTLLHVFSGESGIQPSTVSLGAPFSDNLNFAYNLTLAPGQTQIVMHFASQNPNQATALAKGPQLEDLGLNALAGISDAELQQIVNFAVAPPEQPAGPIFGTPGDDVLEILEGESIVFAGAGNDLIDASQSSGGNRLDGGAGDDELLASSDDRLFGGTGSDILDASAGSGNNRLFGGAGNDLLFAGTNDNLSGGAGDDALFAGQGDNLLTGGAGADVFWVVTGDIPSTPNTITDFEVGTDVIGIGGLDVAFEDLEITQQGNNTLVSLVQTEQIPNGGFETGDFSEWETLGDTSIETAEFGSVPPEGEQQALLTNAFSSVTDAELENFLGLASGSLDGLGNGDATVGSALQQTITVEAGDIVSFDWNFLTSEGTPSGFNDFAFVSIAGDSLEEPTLLSELADTNSSFVDSPTIFNEETGFGTFSYEFEVAGTFTLGVGVVDVSDTIVDSGLLVDNFAITTSTAVAVLSGTSATALDSSSFIFA